MKKVLFLMSLLFLTGLGTASLKAQVRIGGDTVPNQAAVLDLNANNDPTPAANKGALALPRVSLANNTAQLNGATPINGMLVYNTNASMTGGSGEGVYFWNDSNWTNIGGGGVIGNFNPADSAKVLKINANGEVYPGNVIDKFMINASAMTLLASPATVTWTKVHDAYVHVQLNAGHVTQIAATGLRYGDYCVSVEGQHLTHIQTTQNYVYMWSPKEVSSGFNTQIKCYRPSS